MNRTTLTAAAISLLSLQAAHAEFALDPRYTDADGDMIADIPTDAADLSDPGTLVFAYTPVEDPAVYAEVWQEFLDHMAEVTGKDVQFFPVDSNAAQIEAMRAGRLHVAGFNTGSNPLAVACAGFRPFAMMAADDGSFGYEMEIITHPDSGIDDVEGIRGGQMAFTAETSNSGFKAPSALLQAEYDMVAGTDFEPVFSGKHDNSILGVANGDYPAAAIANSVRTRMIERDVVSDDQFKVLYTSETFPTTGYGVAHDLTPELQDKIRQAFFDFDWTGTALEAEFSNSGESQFIEIDFADTWSVVRQIDETMGVEYSCS
ncbi:phosphate/phosphite/phosphonate ABC transporter substrate-binding protein [Paracoccus sp. Ld10]|uniref:phosphate/phosphite/phosphonate ABC transporter substrate-binding protein n=1 Tax=Paracoccus sp. Ld10 TaxID=649158 RepID=UPI003867F2EC